VAGGRFQELSYQLARWYVIPIKGVYLCYVAGLFKLGTSLSGWIIDAIGYKPTPDLDTFMKVMESIPDRARVVLSYRHTRRLDTRGTSIVQVDRHWRREMRLAIRNDETGLWDYKTIGKPLLAVPLTPRPGHFIQLDGVNCEAAAEIVYSFVGVSCEIPVRLDGYPHDRKSGFGLVIDAEKGLVVVSRAVIPHNLCDITVTIATSILVEGKPVFLHPIANFAVVQYNPSLVNAPVRSAKLSAEPITQGADTTFVGFNSNSRIEVAKTKVTGIIATAVPPNPSAPRYRAINLDAITLETGLAAHCSHGVLMDSDGFARALWINYLGEGEHVEYNYGLPISRLLHVISKIRTGVIPTLRILDMEPRILEMSEAPIMGVSDKRIQQAALANPTRPQFFQVWKKDCAPDSGPAEMQSLQQGDIVLTLNDNLITRISEFDVMYDHEVLDALIVRNGEEMRLAIRTVPTEDLETSHVVIFCGAVFQKPHHAVRQLISNLPSEIYISSYHLGSPSHQHGLGPTNFITAVNGVETRDLDSFVKEVNKIEDNTDFALRTVTLNGVPEMITIKKDNHYVKSCYIYL
jgi:hypothetical protein